MVLDKFMGPREFQNILRTRMDFATAGLPNATGQFYVKLIQHALEGEIVERRGSNHLRHPKSQRWMEEMTLYPSVMSGGKGVHGAGASG